MYQFFYCLYYSLFEGSWDITRDPNLKTYINTVMRFILNTLGGEFTSYQYTSFLDATELTAYGLFSNILAVITMFMICFAVLKLTKMVFSIFFGGR